MLFLLKAKDKFRRINAIYFIFWNKFAELFYNEIY
jgi:hypothetical protein